MRLCVFPNDPLVAYYNKGEIKDNYFNPEDIFDEVHCISLTEKDIEVEKVQRLAGNARLEIHSVGKANILNYTKKTKQILDLVESIKPDIIRAYNPLVEGWFAAQCSDKLSIPFVLSIHTQYDFHRKRFKTSNPKKYLVLKYTEKNIEPFVIRKADKIIIVYKIIESYIKRHTDSDPEFIPNGVDLSRFAPSINPQKKDKPVIISVGNLSWVKNHQCLIKAMKDVDAELLIIGDGELYSKLTRLIIENSLESKIKIIRSVPNESMSSYYNKADVFALAYDPEIESVPMPVMEAMACGLPIVVPKARDEYATGLEDVGIISERDPKSFSEKLQMLLNDPSKLKKCSERSYSKSREFDISKIQNKEAATYEGLVKDN